MPFNFNLIMSPPTAFKAKSKTKMVWKPKEEVEAKAEAKVEANAEAESVEILIKDNIRPLDDVLEIKRDKIVYTLKLQHGKYYVGIKNIDDEGRRLRAHLFPDELHPSKRTNWISQYSVLTDDDSVPIEHVELSNQSVIDEDIVTRQLMYIYGYENVRGGSFSQPFFFPNEKNGLLQTLPPEKYTEEMWNDPFLQLDRTICLFSLQNGKYYLASGYSVDDACKTAKNNEWVKKNGRQQCELKGVSAGCTWFHLDGYVTAAIQKYGLLNVRGGSFDGDEFTWRTTQNGIDGWNRQAKFLASALNLCYICSSSLHISKRCPYYEEHAGGCDTTRPIWC